MRSKTLNSGSQAPLPTLLMVESHSHSCMLIAIEKEKIAQLKTAADFNREAEEKKKAEE